MKKLILVFMLGMAMGAYIIVSSSPYDQFFSIDSQNYQKENVNIQIAVYVPNRYGEYIKLNAVKFTVDSQLVIILSENKDFDFSEYKKQ